MAAVVKASDTDPTLQTFASSMAVPGWRGNSDQIANVKSAVQTLASYYMMQGATDAQTAVSTATKNVLGLKYDFDSTGGPSDTYRVPLNSLPQAHAMISQMEGNLGSLISPNYAGATPHDDPTAQARYNDLLQTPKIWLTNDSDTGLFMAFRRMDGAVVPVYGKNNQPIGFNFTDMGKMDPADLIAPGPMRSRQ
jgi:hypothetical protein